jgi:plastocyanin
MTAVTCGCSSGKALPNSSSAGQNGRRTSGTTANSPDMVTPAQVVRISGDDSLRFSPASLTVKPGPLRLVFTATGKMPQTLSSPTLLMDSGNVPAGHTVTIDVLIPRPGKYRFYSAYHKKQGMTGKIIARR